MMAFFVSSNWERSLLSWPFRDVLSEAFQKRCFPGGLSTNFGLMYRTVKVS